MARCYPWMTRRCPWTARQCPLMMRRGWWTARHCPQAMRRARGRRAVARGRQGVACGQRGIVTRQRGVVARHWNGPMDNETLRPCNATREPGNESRWQGDTPVKPRSVSLRTPGVRMPVAKITSVKPGLTGRRGRPPASRSPPARGRDAPAELASSLVGSHAASADIGAVSYQHDQATRARGNHDSELLP